MGTKSKKSVYEGTQSPFVLDSRHNACQRKYLFETRSIPEIVWNFYVLRWRLMREYAYLDEWQHACCKLLGTKALFIKDVDLAGNMRVADIEGCKSLGTKALC